MLIIWVPSRVQTCYLYIEFMETYGDRGTPVITGHCTSSVNSAPPAVPLPIPEPD